MTAFMHACVPVNSPGGHVMWDVSCVRPPGFAGQLLQLQSKIPQRRGA